MCKMSIDNRFTVSHISGDGSQAGGVRICAKMPKEAYLALAHFPEQYPKAEELRRARRTRRVHTQVDPVA